MVRMVFAAVGEQKTAYMNVFKTLAHQVPEKGELILRAMITGNAGLEA